LSEAINIERIALAEVRLLQEAQRGNSNAVVSLLRPYLPAVWSICRSHLPDDDHARAALIDFRAQLPGALRTYANEHPFGVQLFGTLWDHLSATLEPSGPVVIHAPALTTAPAAAGPGGRDQDVVLNALRDVEPLARLVWLFGTVTALRADRLSDLTRLPEMRVRKLRARVSYHLHQTLNPRPSHGD